VAIAGDVDMLVSVWRAGRAAAGARDAWRRPGVAHHRLARRPGLRFQSSSMFVEAAHIAYQNLVLGAHAVERAGDGMHEVCNRDVIVLEAVGER